LGPPPPRPFTLSWSHYVFLLGVKDPNERSFYEIEATEQNWTVRHLKRQFHSGLYERLALSQDKEGIRKLAREGQTVAQASDLLKEPLVLGGISHRCSRALTWRRHSSLPRRHSCRRWSATLYHAREQVSRRVSTRQARVPAPPRCYVLIDLKLGKIAHQDLGQMQMYVNYFDRFVKTAEENSTIGIVLCKRKNKALVEITLPKDANIHAREYQLYLPSKDELQQKLMEWIGDRA
jgi:hypothetical protein